MAAPLTKEEREKLHGWAQDVYDEEEDSAELVGHALKILRYEATVQDLESERDGLRDEVRELRELLDAATVF